MPATEQGCFIPPKKGGLRVSTQKHCQCLLSFFGLVIVFLFFSDMGNLRPAIKRAKRKKE